MDLLRDLHEPRTASRQVRHLRRTVAALRRGGHVRRDQGREIELTAEGFDVRIPGDVTTLGGVQQLLLTQTAFPVTGLASKFTVAEQMLVSTGLNTGKAISTSASTIIGRESTGGLKAMTATQAAGVLNALVGGAWPYQRLTGSDTIAAGTAQASVAPGSNMTVTLATPTGAKVLIVADDDSNIGGSSGVRFITAGSETINGSSDWPSGGSHHTTADAIFVLSYHPTPANWTGVMIS